MKKFIELFCSKYKLGFSLLFIFLLLMISYLVYINNDSSVKASDSGFEEINDIVGSAVADIKNNQKIKIDVKGLVANPGVYELNEGSRVIDAIEAAGGILDDGDSSSLNLSKILKDENVIVVTSKESKQPEYIIEYVYQECNCKEYNDACLDEENIVNYKSDNNNKTQNNESNTDNSSNLISINTATKEQLQTLNGVGESKALAIIKYREEVGNFSTIEDIKNVSGIGDSLFDKIKEYITV